MLDKTPKWAQHLTLRHSWVRTHSVLLYLTLTLILTFDLSIPKTMSFLEYPKVIPYTKFEPFGIIRFWVMLRILVWKCTYWLCDLDLWPFYPKTMSLIAYRTFQDDSLYQVWTLWDFSFLSYTADKQTDKQTDGANILPTPTDSSAWVIIIIIMMMMIIIIIIIIIHCSFYRAICQQIQLKQ